MWGVPNIFLGGDGGGRRPEQKQIYFTKDILHLINVVAPIFVGGGGAFSV